MNTINLLRGGVLAAILIITAHAQQPPRPHLIKSHMTHDDAEYWYHLQTFSTGTNRVYKARKPNPEISRQLIATNDLPVQVQYVYRVLRADLTVITNTAARAKTPRERAKITVPELRMLMPPQPGKADALGHALKRARPSSAGALAPRISEPVTHKTMAPRDPVQSREIIKGEIHHHHKSGRTTITPLKRMHTARVTAPNFAPPKTTDDIHVIGDHPHVPKHQLINALETALKHLPPDGQITGHPAVLLTPGERLRQQAAAADKRENDILFIQHTLQQLKKPDSTLTPQKNQ